MSQSVGMVERSSYHHGDLRNALLDAATELAAAGGPAAVQLRDAARQVGVSHNAGYRHFANRDALLDAVATRGFDGLAEAMRHAVAAVPSSLTPAERARANIRAIGRSYVDFAVESPGLFRTAFATRGRPEDVPDLPGGELTAYQMLVAAVDDLVATGEMPPERRPHAEVAAWSAVHGLAMLLLDGPLHSFSAAERAAALDRLLETVQAGL